MWTLTSNPAAWQHLWDLKTTLRCVLCRYEETTLTRVRVVPGGKVSLILLGGVAASIIGNQAYGSIAGLLCN